MDQAPAYFLTLILTTLFVVSLRHNPAFVSKLLSPESLPISTSALLFATTLVAHLFEPNPWTESTLQILVGIIVGTATQSFSSSTTGSQTAIGDNNRQAGHDLIENFKTLESNLSGAAQQITSASTTIQQATAVSGESIHVNPKGWIDPTSTPTHRIDFEYSFSLAVVVDNEMINRAEKKAYVHRSDTSLATSIKGLFEAYLAMEILAQYNVTRAIANQLMGAQHGTLRIKSIRVIEAAKNGAVRLSVNADFPLPIAENVLHSVDPSISAPPRPMTPPDPNRRQR